MDKNSIEKVAPCLKIRTIDETHEADNTSTVPNCKEVVPDGNSEGTTDNTSTIPNCKGVVPDGNSEGATESTSELSSSKESVPDGNAEGATDKRNSLRSMNSRKTDCLEHSTKPKSALASESVTPQSNCISTSNFCVSNKSDVAISHTCPSGSSKREPLEKKDTSKDVKQTNVKDINNFKQNDLLNTTYTKEQLIDIKKENVENSEEDTDALLGNNFLRLDQGEIDTDYRSNNGEEIDNFRSLDQNEEERSINVTKHSNEFDPIFSYMDADSDKESLELKADIKLETIREEDENSYQGETTSLDPLNQTNCSDIMYCETSFAKCDVESDLTRWNSKRKHSKTRDRKESLEQRLRRRFTIHDEHKQEVAKRILVLVIKYSLFVFNFCSWVIAAVAIGLGLWVLTDKGKIVTDSSDFFLDPTIMVCIVGGITFVVAFLGCVGALRENLLLLKVFFVVLGIIVVIEVVIAITIFVMYTVPEVKDKFLRSTPENILRSAILRYMDDSDLKEWIDLIQQENLLIFTSALVKWRPFNASQHFVKVDTFRCCGIGGVDETDEGFRDWQINTYFNCTSSNKSIYRCAVPTSCCIFEKGDRINIMCGFEMADKKLIDVRDYIYTRGCIHGFGEWLSKYDELIVIASLSTLIMQFLAVISAKVMIRRIEKTRQRWSLLLRSSSSS